MTDGEGWSSGALLEEGESDQRSASFDQLPVNNRPQSGRSAQGR